ncbi:inositol monophosphatase family protein [Lihuaxuella thermophila]|uniref:Myo-inositol-1(Or 4)-monophosphatase n=1 Tax=Lihuaxuella thermophila TaxID=1173111 RepID=A0A1H8G3M5_9BACL|nr:inositol monophosphatase family protein [Lihuaxuella thermophila]SEN38394.1 myo-inositol-1(or 4)-monophosphatase [Lihuaxuella thermophila]
MSCIHDHAYRQTKEWARQAGSLIRGFLQSGEIKVETKKHEADLVTVVDRAVENFFVERIGQHFPDHKILGEEGIGEKPADFSGYVWLIDPIDGTSNFVTQQADFVVSVALYHDGQGIFGVVYDVMRDEMYHAIKGQGMYVNGIEQTVMRGNLALIDSLISFEYNFPTEAELEKGRKLLGLCSKIRGMRSYGATALAMAKVAAGKNNGFVTMGTNPWDYGAGKVLVEEAGGIVTDFKGNPLSLERRSSVIACHPAIYQELLQFVSDLA